MRDGARTGSVRSRCADEGRVYVPDAPTDRAGAAGRVSDLRHGTGTAGGRSRREAESRADRHDAPVLDRGRSGDSGFSAHDGRYGARRRRHALHRYACGQLDWPGIHDPGGPLGGLAVLRSSVGLDRQPQSEYVYADRDGDRRGLCVQRARNDRAGHLPGGVPSAWRCRDVFRHRGGHHGVGPHRASAGIAGAQPYQRGAQAVARPGPSYRTSREKRERA